MTVRELIERLSEFDRELPVVSIKDGDQYHWVVIDVSQQTVPMWRYRLEKPELEEVIVITSDLW